MQCTCARDFLFIYQIKRAKTILHIFSRIHVFNTFAALLCPLAKFICAKCLRTLIHRLSTDRQKSGAARSGSGRQDIKQQQKMPASWECYAVLQHNDLKQIHGRCVCCLKIESIFLAQLHSYILVLFSYPFLWIYSYENSMFRHSHTALFIEIQTNTSMYFLLPISISTYRMRHASSIGTKKNKKRTVVRMDAENEMQWVTLWVVWI